MIGVSVHSCFPGLIHCGVLIQWIVLHMLIMQKCQNYSRFWCPGLSAIDAFTANWADDMNWWVPPFNLVGRILRHAEICHAVGSLVVPAWKSASFWPLLCLDGSRLAPFIHQWLYIPFQPTMFITGKSGHNIGDALTLDSVILCLYLDFSSPPRAYPNGFCTRDFTGACTICTQSK